MKLKWEASQTLFFSDLKDFGAQVGSKLARKNAPRLVKTGQDRTGQDRTGQDRTGQDRTGQDRTGQDKTGQDRTGRTGRTRRTGGGSGGLLPPRKTF